MSNRIDYYSLTKVKDHYNSHIFSVENITPETLELLFKNDSVDNEEKAATVLITDNQLIVTTNGPYADQNHRETLVNIHNQIYRHNMIVDPLDYFSIEKYMQKNFIVGKLINIPNESVYAMFPIASIRPHFITPNQLEIFNTFYEKYNYVFSEVSKRENKPIVCYSYLNENNETEEKWCNDLKPIFFYLQRIVGKEKDFEKNEKIIGEEEKKKLK